jgi:glycerol-3-phosphate dehydrogenase
VKRYDLLVIGGGINGLGIAADAAARGLSVLVVEKADFGAATTAASSRLIHGGLRYLQYGELGLVRESLRERGLLARQRPHLVRPIELLIPAYRGQPPPLWKVRAGLFLYDQLARDPLFEHPRSFSAAGVREREPGLAAAGLEGGHAYPDGQVEFPERLCVELMRETVAAGGEAWNHTRVVALEQAGGRVTGARLEDTLTGEERHVEAAWTVNAAGPWVDAVNRLLGTPAPRLVGGTVGTHLVLPLRAEGPRGALYARARKDGRPFFLLPWDGRLLVGTTDHAFEGDPDALRVQEWEVEYLLAETDRLFPGCGYTEADIQMTTVGIRPLPASNRAAGAITRRHFVVDHAAQGAAGLFSIVGGKLTTYRSLAEEMVNRLTRVPCATRAGGEAPSLERMERETEATVRRLGLEPAVAGRLVRLYGPRAGEVLARVERDPALGRALLPGGLALAAEAMHALQSEGARTVEDVLRRRLVLLPPPPGAAAAVRAVCGDSLPER